MFKIIFILISLMMLIGVSSAEIQTQKAYGEQGGGLPNNPFIDGIKNDLLSLLTISISCGTGYSYCYENNYIYGDAQAMARVYISEPYVEGGNLYVNYRGDGAKYYRYRGITSWSEVSCDSSGCNGQLIGSNERTLLGSAPSTSQQGVVYVVWDYNSYNGYWAWTWVGFGWFGNFNYNLQLPKCSDGTSYNSCSVTKPKYCDNGNLINKATTCGCPSGYDVSGDSCIIHINKCSDGTPYNSCSVTKPKYCDNGNLIDKATTCGCPSGYDVSGDSCIIHINKCGDGTLYNACSVTKPKYCDNGNLIDKATTCGCPTGKTPSGDSCVVVNTNLIVLSGIIMIVAIGLLFIGRKKRR